eukprot:CAMPEP_0201539770 /NCGR_PEP_ID=MMETSP0161_2-20130828/70582_1 /ASSEMBLY_ACC=CAM_ASM_000251 /TAXON_ID=180227 /ORGANISM="Neoparamoeba aestuarina, Strain SoJaBio B1-5/56/2" /LENGTH=502 /DNA_ID=CAMNT_0047947187 /DNA_START=452 /DNA_END=1960 /DNA_ORIENTATION=-
MMKLVCAFVMVVGLVVAQNQPFPDSFGAAASPQALTGLVNDIVLPIVDEIIYKVGSVLPSDCCYQNIGIGGSHVYLENLSIPKESIISSATVQTSARGIFFETTTNFNLTFYLHICEQLGPHCTTVFRCKDDANIVFTTDLSMLVNIYPDENGQPIVSATDFAFTLTADTDGLCNLLDILIANIVPVVNEAVNEIAPPFINKGLTALLHDIPQTFVLPEPFFDLHWAMTNNTGSSSDGTSLMFDVEVLIKSMMDEPGPFVPDPSIPNALIVLEGPGALGLDFSDAIINNIVYSIFAVENPTFNTKAEGFNVEITFPESPVFSFTGKEGLDSASLTLTLKVLLKKSILHITAHATATAYFEIVVLSEGKLTLQLNPDDLNVTITSTSPPTTNGTKTMITQGIEDTWASAVPGINNKLINHAVPLPHIADFNHPYISYGNGYAAVGFDTIKQNTQIEDVKFLEQLIKVIMEQLVQDGGINCPNLAPIGAQPIECEDVSFYDNEE